jgi:hypothetical protein
MDTLARPLVCLCPGTGKSAHPTSVVLVLIHSLSAKETWDRGAIIVVRSLRDLNAQVDNAMNRAILVRISIALFFGIWNSHSKHQNAYKTTLSEKRDPKRDTLHAETSCFILARGNPGRRRKWR